MESGATTCFYGVVVGLALFGKKFRMFQAEVLGQCLGESRHLSVQSERPFATELAHRVT